MAQIICLANSKKEGERCIAGVDVQTGEWIRPVSSREDGAITSEMRLIDGREPQLLDILDILLEISGPDEGFQPENRLLRNGPWKRIGRIKPEDLLEYCEKDPLILHNRLDYVPFRYFSTMPRIRWKSLQLVHNKRVVFRSGTWRGRVRWRASFRYGRLFPRLDLRITDPVILRRLSDGEQLNSDCILAISLAMPWSPNSATAKRCYKLIAGVVET